MSLEKMQEKALIRMAVEARRSSYSPYSGFMVGACLETADGKYYTGCNIENAAYTPTNCAERTAFFKAVSEGEKSFRRMAVVGGARGGGPQFCTPCGVCRQVMMEFCEPDRFQILVAKTEEEYRIYTLAELLPNGFGPENLEGGLAYADV